MASFEFNPAIDDNSGEPLARKPWNNIIFPGNYVAHLNAYRDQGVVALPGAVFFRSVGALVLNPDNDGVTNVDGTLAAGTYNLQILSPDLRQDDKPRKDRPMVIPEGATIYRHSVNAPGVREATVAGTATITIATGDLAPPNPVPATADAEGYFAPVGEFSLFEGILNGTTVLSADTPVQVTTSQDLIASQNPSAGACRKAPSAIIVEVCYYMPDAAPDADDLHIPYGVEAGQGY
jgi:hypothetical protein